MITPRICFFICVCDIDDDVRPAPRVFLHAEVVGVSDLREFVDVFFLLLALGAVFSSSSSSPLSVERDRVALHRCNVLPFRNASPGTCDVPLGVVGDEGGGSVCPPDEKAPAGIAREPEGLICWCMLLLLSCPFVRGPICWGG